MNRENADNQPRPAYELLFKEIRHYLENFNRQELLDFVDHTNELIAEAKRLLSLECSQVIENVPKEVWREVLMRISNKPLKRYEEIKYGDTEEEERFLKSLACVSKTFSQLIDQFVPMRFKGYENVSHWILSKCLDVEKIDFKKLFGYRHAEFREDLLEKYTNLRELVRPNYFVQFLGESLKNLSRLTKLDLRECDHVPADTLSKLTSLESLDIRNNEEYYLEALRTLPRLNSLQVDSFARPFLDSLSISSSLISLEYSVARRRDFSLFPRMPHVRTLVSSLLFEIY